MSRHVKFVLRLMIALCISAVMALAASAQTDSAIQNFNNRSAVAYVYVASGNQKSKLSLQRPTGSSLPSLDRLSELARLPAWR